MVTQSNLERELQFIQLVDEKSRNFFRDEIIPSIRAGLIGVLIYSAFTFGAHYFKKPEQETSVPRPTTTAQVQDAHKFYIPEPKSDSPYHYCE